MLKIYAWSYHRTSIMSIYTYTNTNTNIYTYVLPFYASGSTRSLPPKIHKHKHKHIYICSPLLRLRFNPVPSSETHIYHHTISICKICRKYHNFVSNSNKYLRNWKHMIPKIHIGSILAYLTCLFISYSILLISTQFYSFLLIILLRLACSTHFVWADLAVSNCLLLLPLLLLRLPCSLLLLLGKEREFLKRERVFEERESFDQKCWILFILLYL